MDKLFVQNYYNGEYTEIDLDSAWMDQDVIDADSLFQVLIVKISIWALENDHLLKDIVGYTLDEGSDELALPQTPGDLTWLMEVSKLVAWRHTPTKHYMPDGALMARINDIGWKFFDFDSDLQEAEDMYSQEFDGDYAEYAREYMENCGEGLSEWAEPYFNYEEYGEDLVDGYDRVEWDNQEYLFHR